MRGSSGFSFPRSVDDIFCERHRDAQISVTADLSDWTDLRREIIISE